MILAAFLLHDGQNPGIQYPRTWTIAFWSTNCAVPTPPREEDPRGFLARRKYMSKELVSIQGILFFLYWCCGGGVSRSRMRMASPVPVRTIARVEIRPRLLEVKYNPTAIAGPNYKIAIVVSAISAERAPKRELTNISSTYYQALIQRFPSAEDQVSGIFQILQKHFHLEIILEAVCFHREWKKPWYS